MIERADNTEVPGPVTVLTALDVAVLLRLTEDYERKEDAAEGVLRLVREHGLRPISGCGRSYKFSEAEVSRWVATATEAFELKGKKSLDSSR